MFMALLKFVDQSVSFTLHPHGKESLMGTSVIIGTGILGQYTAGPAGFPKEEPSK